MMTDKNINIGKLRTAARDAAETIYGGIQPLREKERKLRGELASVTSKIKRLARVRKEYLDIWIVLCHISAGASLVGESDEQQIERIISSGNKDVRLTEWIKKVLSEEEGKSDAS